ncbi:oxidoreductase [Amycolatopsis anabasis]|uniref:oxidoreductase n=1 Tax=Amycolatopsis anabasis TaxID=1840409 RepID=UPI00131E1987|nr:oxidoreductase [Amycolatopsis anabasis]
MANWTAADIPDQHGRTAVVTGANSGLGLVAAKELARAGARVILACRDVGKGKDAAAGMTGDVEVRALDLADLASVRAFADSVDGPVDMLINNAGLMAVPRGQTRDGFETQFGVNHLGHFALTGLLLDRITDRVVSLSSFMHRIGRIRLSDPNFTRRYGRWSAYGQSKLANLMFAYELQRRLADAGSDVRSMAAHPGYANTNLQGRTESIQDFGMRLMNRFLAQSAERGALPTLYAATKPDLPGGSFAGPNLPGEMWGHPHRVRSNRASRDREVQRKLWELSEELTGVRYDFAVLRR